MKDLILRFLFKADNTDVKKKIKDVEKDAKQAGNKIGSSLKRAFAGLGTTVAGLGLSRVFKSAINDAAALEQSLLKLRAAAQNTGQDFGTIEKGLQRLRSEGTLSFQTITEASQQLLQQGFRADQVEPFLRALRNIGALENTVGDTNAALQSFIRAISTNSIELVDNLSPALRKTVLELGGFNEISKNADKQQEFFNITLERGAMFADAYGESIDTLAGKQAQLDVETGKLSEAFGQALAPAFESTLELLTPLVSGLTDFINGLSGSGKSLIAAGASAAVAATGFTALAVAIGASATAATVLTGGLIVLAAAATTYAASQSQINSEVENTKKTVESLQAKLKALDKVQSSDSRKAQLIEDLKVATNNYNTALIKRIELERNANLASVEALKTEKERITFQRTQALNILQERSTIGLTGPQQKILRQGSVAQVEKLTKQIKTGQVKGFRGNLSPEVISALDLLPLLAEETKAVSAALSSAQRASKKYSSALNTSKKKKEEETEAIEDATEPLEGFFRGLENLEGALETAAFELESATSDIDSMTDSIETLKDASTSTTEKIRALGSGLTGIGGLLGQLGFKGTGTQFEFLGAGLGLVGAAGGLLNALFGRGPQESIDTNKILDQQLEIQRQQFALQKEQAGIEKKYFEDNLELIRQRARIEGRDPAEELSKAIAAELERLEFKGGISLESLELQRTRVKQESEIILLNKERIRQVEEVRKRPARTLTASLRNIEEIARIRREAGLTQLIDDPSRVSNLGEIINQTILELTALTQEGQALRIQQLLEQGVGLIPTGSGAPTSAPTSTSLAQPTQLVQAQSRGFGIIDISRGGLQTATGFSVTRGAAMAAQAGVPATLGSLAVATEAMKTTEDQMLDTLNSQLSELKRQTEILGQLTGQDVTVAVLNALSSAKTRSI